MKELLNYDFQLPIGRLMKSGAPPARVKLSFSQNASPSMKVNRQLQIRNRQSTYAPA
jgi:hypothetical protein